MRILYDRRLRVGREELWLPSGRRQLALIWWQSFVSPTAATAARPLLILSRAATCAVVGHPRRPFFRFLWQRDRRHRPKIIQIIAHVVGHKRRVPLMKTFN